MKLPAKLAKKFMNLIKGFLFFFYWVKSNHDRISAYGRYHLKWINLLIPVGINAVHSANLSV